MDFSNMEFGDILKTIRNEKGWSQEKMAECLGTTKQAISRYERGERTPKITVAAKFADQLGIELSDLIGYEYHDSDPSFEDAMDVEKISKFTADDYHLLEDIHENRKLRTIIDNLRRLNQDDIDLLIKLLKRLLGDTFTEYKEV